MSNVIGNRDVIRNGVNGLICNSAREYANAICDIVNGKIDGVLISENASEDVEQNYNVELMAQQYDEIYTGSNVIKKYI